jgi:hypothetical protein
MKFVTRLYDMVLKYTSVKGSIFLVSTVLLAVGKIDAYLWSLFAVVFVGVRAIEKAIIALKGEKTESDGA